eukprot:831554-Rhodomonas_salina.1
MSAVAHASRVHTPAHGDEPATHMLSSHIPALSSAAFGSAFTSCEMKPSEEAGPASASDCALWPEERGCSNRFGVARTSARQPTPSALAVQSCLEQGSTTVPR